VLAELIMPLCRTLNQRDAKHDDSRRFYTIRNTLNNVARMGADNGWTVSTKVDKDSDGNLLQATAIDHRDGWRKQNGQILLA